MNVLDIIKVAGIVLVSLLGGSGIVAIVVKYAAGWLSQRLLDHYNNEHEKELEGIKARYTEALAKTQLELDKAERRHFLYSQSQFELYNSLWKQLVYTKRIADDLWRVADPQKLPSFADQIRQTKFVIEENMLLIEDEHYAALMKLMTEFENFSVGKRKLVEIRQSSAADVLDNIEDIRRMIHENGGSKQRYDALVEKVGASFRNQIHG